MTHRDLAQVRIRVIPNTLGMIRSFERFGFEKQPGVTVVADHYKLEAWKLEVGLDLVVTSSGLNCVLFGGDSVLVEKLAFSQRVEPNGHPSRCPVGDPAGYRRFERLSGHLRGSRSITSSVVSVR